MFQDLGVKEEDEYTFDVSSGSIAQMQRVTQIDKHKIVLKGNLLKKNRYWKK